MTLELLDISSTFHHSIILEVVSLSLTSSKSTYGDDGSNPNTHPQTTTPYLATSPLPAQTVKNK